MKILEYIFQFLIFPGFLFSAVMGLLVGWVDRKVTARIQWRVGPPWYQNFVDIAKLLFYKETLIPQGVSKAVFLGMPILAAASATLASTMILAANGSPAKGFIGDIVVGIFLLIMPSLAAMIGGFASKNPLACLGASREMKLTLSFVIPFILALTVPIIKSGYTIKLGNIITAQTAHGYIIGSVSGAISSVIMLLCVHAGLRFVPFDMPEAETEIESGPYIEYSGRALGIFKLARAIMGFAAPILIITLYFGGIKLDPEGFVKNVLQFMLILVMMVVIKNTNPRVKIGQAVRFFLGPVTILSAAAAALAYFGY